MFCPRCRHESPGSVPICAVCGQILSNESIEPIGPKVGKKIDTVGIQWKRKETLRTNEEKKRITIKEPLKQEPIAKTVPIVAKSSAASSRVRSIAVIFDLFSPDGRTVSLPVGDFKIGSGSNCELVINSEESSKLHAILSVGEDSLSLTDTSSKGTVINGRMVLQKGVDLLVMNSVQIGNSKIVIFFIPGYLKRNLMI